MQYQNKDPREAANMVDMIVAWVAVALFHHLTLCPAFPVVTLLLYQNSLQDWRGGLLYSCGICLSLIHFFHRRLIRANSNKSFDEFLRTVEMGAEGQVGLIEGKLVGH